MKKILFSLLALTMSAVTAFAQDPGCPTPSLQEASVTFKRKLPGALEGEFVINGNGDKVVFAQGNLQYNSNEQKWQFAANQLEIIGGSGGSGNVSPYNVASGNNSVTTTGKLNNTGVADLFGWNGTSSTNYVVKYGLDFYGLSSDRRSNYYGTRNDALLGDWGQLKISNGGNKANSGWRVLTSTEWEYVFKTRGGAKVVMANSWETKDNARYIKATVVGVKGLILFPDGGVFDGVSLFGGSPCINCWNSNYAATCTVDQWRELEAAGCVFLPAAGYRSGTSVYDAGAYCYYWTSDGGNSDQYAIAAMVKSSSVSGNDNQYRTYCSAVRLVKDLH